MTGYDGDGMGVDPKKVIRPSNRVKSRWHRDTKATCRCPRCGNSLTLVMESTPKKCSCTNDGTEFEVTPEQSLRSFAWNLVKHGDSMAKRWFSNKGIAA